MGTSAAETHNLFSAGPLEPGSRPIHFAVVSKAQNLEAHRAFFDTNRTFVSNLYVGSIGWKR